MSRFGETIVGDDGRALGSIKQTKKGNFIRKYLVDSDSDDACIVIVHANSIQNLPDNPAGLKVRFGSTDFVFAVE